MLAEQHTGKGKGCMIRLAKELLIIDLYLTRERPAVFTGGLLI